VKPAYDMVVMGDINLDWYSKGELSYPFSNLVQNGVIEWRPIDELPGGSGLNFARFAHQAGYRSMLLGKIGDDPAGEFIRQQLQEYGLETEGITVASHQSTGKAFIARDKNGIRFLVNNTPNANRALSVPDVEQHTQVLKSCQVLYVSGYCLMEPKAPRTKATLRAMELAHGKSVTVVFDVVPHQFYKIYNFSQFQDLTTNVDILISEVPTMRRFLEMGNRSEIITHSVVEETIERLAELYNRFILRFGPSGCDEQVIWDAQTDNLIWEETKHDKFQDKRGYGDRLAIKVLKDVFEIAPAL
jgi:sugar/nucleoside kinase (ribokinase family)